MMSTSSSARMGIVAFLAILTVSAGTMLWLFWRFPLMTAIVTLGVFAALVVLARLARSIDVDLQDLDRTEQSI
jgi:CHASE2 domain-containing sensor protein